MTNEAPTLRERYLCGARSLQVDDTHHGADHILAVAMVDDSLGALMWRAMREFDAARGDLNRTLQPIDRALILAGMRSLKPAREAVGRWADIQATKRSVIIRPEIVAKIVGRVLDVWLDPICHHCDGKGFTGGTHRGEKADACHACGGSGVRTSNLGKGAVEQAFGAWLLAELDYQLAKFERMAREKMR